MSAPADKPLHTYHVPGDVMRFVLHHRFYALADLEAAIAREAELADDFELARIHKLRAANLRQQAQQLS